MAKDEPTSSGPDLRQRIALSDLEDGSKLVGHVEGEEVLLVRRGMQIFAVGAPCTHYHGPIGVDDIPIDYVGQAEKWDELAIEGEVAARDGFLRSERNGRLLAVASTFRDIERLDAEVVMERVAALEGSRKAQEGRLS